MSLLNIDVNKNVEDPQFDEDVLKGFNAKDSIVIVFALVIGVLMISGAYYLLHWPLMVAVYAATPFIAIIIVLGFFNRNGLGLIKGLKKSFQKNKGKPLTYMSTESPDLYLQVRCKNLVLSEEKSRENKQLEKKKIILKLSILILGIVLLLILAAVAAIWFKGR
jgi:hypothetical protein